MKRIHTLFLALVLTATAMADHVSQTDALQTAREFFASSLFTAKSNALGGTTQTAAVTLADQDEGYYIFNREGGGYVVIAADDKARSQVLGYSFSGTLQADDMPQGMRDLLDTYNQELTQSSTTASGLKLTDLPLLATTGERHDIEPMITTRWGQDEPYHNAIVALEGNSSIAPAGCGATALAQVMNYHQYPDCGQGTSTITLVNGSKYTVDLSGSTYDWDLIGSMIDNTSYTEEQGEAVSQFFLDVAAAANSLFTDEYGEAQEQDLPKALIENFNYDPQLYLARHGFYTSAEWDELMYNELAEGRPIIYCATALMAGHGFILDGYADGYYHVNWGWDGYEDGYFLLYVLYPYSTYRVDISDYYNFIGAASAVIGIQPPIEGHTDITGVVDTAAVRLACTEGSGKTAGYAFEGFFFNPYYATITIVPALQVEDADGNTTWLDDAEDTTITLLREEHYTTHGTFSFADLDDGTYTLRPAYYDTADGEHHLIPVSYATDFVAAQITVSGDELTWQDVTRGRNLSCYDLTFDAPADSLYAGEQHTISANVTNNGSSFVYSAAYLLLLDAETDTTVTRSWSFTTVILEPDETDDVKFILNMPEAGTYNIVLVDQDNTIFYSGETLTVQPTPTAVGDIQAATPAATALAIYDTQGRLLLRQHAAEPDLSTLPQGIYVVKTPDGASKVVRK